ncbi:hypothetical protein ABZP36_018959 [Zizania latifolia]
MQVSIDDVHVPKVMLNLTEFYVCTLINVSYRLLVLILLAVQNKSSKELLPGPDLLQCLKSRRPTAPIFLQLFQPYLDLVSLIKCDCGLVQVLLAASYQIHLYLTGFHSKVFFMVLLPHVNCMLKQVLWTGWN